MQTLYLVVGSSHAALEAVEAIRMHDAQGSLTLLTRDPHLPYSPTLLPYVVSGRAAPERAWLRDERYFTDREVRYLAGRTLAALHPDRGAALLADGTEIRYDKVLLATGAAPVIPPIAGIAEVGYHVLRTLDDALKLKAAIAGSRRAVVVGGGLVGMHAAEHLVEAGADVTVVEVQPQVLGGYFDRRAAAIIEREFAGHGARILAGRRVVGLARAAGATRVQLEGGEHLDADLLLIAAGVRPQLSYLAGSGIEHADGVLVDDSMRASHASVWAAGDCAQARDFYRDIAVLNPILPDAAEQGRIAGTAMAGDPSPRRYDGGVPLNTYRFFGRFAISVGQGAIMDGAEERVRVDEAAGCYLRVVFSQGRLQGIFGVGEFFDGGVMWQLIRRRVDMAGCMERLVADPLATGRELMSRLWR
ncbi:MAG TPA: FAD-dependent oxidoreductase [Burkholderiaceae bacterium]